MPLERFLVEPERWLAEGFVCWLAGGQADPRPDRAPRAYAGYGCARLMLDRAASHGATIHRVSSLDLLSEWDFATQWFARRELIFLDRPELALPTPRLRAVLEHLLASAWENRGALLVATSLSPRRDASSLPSWRAFAERVGPVLGSDGYASLRSGLTGDPAVPILGELHPLMLRPLSFDDYLSPRSLSLLARASITDSATTLAA